MMILCIVYRAVHLTARKTRHAIQKVSVSLKYFFSRGFKSPQNDVFIEKNYIT